jgi:hypothetical protein
MRSANQPHQQSLGLPHPRYQGFSASHVRDLLAIGGRGYEPLVEREQSASFPAGRGDDKCPSVPAPVLEGVRIFDLDWFLLDGPVFDKVLDYLYGLGRPDEGKWIRRRRC